MDECKKKFVIKPDVSLTKGDKGDKGDPGVPASSFLPLSSDDIIYSTTNQVLTEVLDEILYIALNILTFNATSLLYEKGQTLTSLGVTWSYNKTIDSQAITGTGVTPPTLLVSDRAITLTLASVTTNTVITLTADDVTGDTHSSKSSSITLQFLNKIYKGKAAHPGTINSAFLNSSSLTKSLEADRIDSFQVITGATEYIWFALPVAYGAPLFISNGLIGGFQLELTFSHTNESGYSESYNVYRSVNSNLGTVDIQVL